MAEITASAGGNTGAALRNSNGCRWVRASPHFSVGGVKMAPDFSLQRVLETEERSGHYLRAAHMDQSILGLGP